ncbi:MAG TPA: HNH endonuclease [Ignavibacteria bacterium]|jgi:hypothetical protein
MKYILKTYHYNISDKELLNDLKSSAESLGKCTITGDEYMLEGAYGKRTIERRFGSWNNALLKAGLKIKRPASADELMKNLKKVWDRLKCQPLRKDMKPPLSQYSPETYVRKFGSWRKALEEFVKRHSSNSSNSSDSSGSQVYGPLSKKSAARPRKNKTKRKKHRQNITKSMRYDILKRDDFRCQHCGRSPATVKGLTLHIDHIIPRSKNGPTEPYNLQTLCSDCNYGKSNKS